MNGKKEFGDYQTPLYFVEKVCNLLIKKYVAKPDVVIEPTCGLGNFLKKSLIFNAKNYYGIEINEAYCEECKKAFADISNITIYNENIFSCDIQHLVVQNKETLVIGNPPWVTNSELSKNDSTNIPQKANFKSFNGFNAITGASNFDICEYIILNLVESIKNENAVMAMLCKTSVARNIFSEINRRCINYTSFSLYTFDARQVFKISATACLLVLDFRGRCKSHLPCTEFDIDSPFDQIKSLVYSESGMIVPIHGVDFWGKCCFEWRQGVKHDCSKIMEIATTNGVKTNGFGEHIDIEDTYVFPLIKSSMVKQPIINTFQKQVIVTQTKIKEDTSKIGSIAPKTWQYLLKYKERFDSRKSSIYKNAPPFSMFGIGDYSFAKYKVAISGFYKLPLFSLVYSEEKAVMCDDTSYFIPFSDYDEAYTAMLVLNSDKVRSFLQSVSFQDAKRPFTKQLLNKLDIKAIINSVTIDDMIKTELSLNLPLYINSTIFDRFCETVCTSGILNNSVYATNAS